MFNTPKTSKIREKINLKFFLFCLLSVSVFLFSFSYFGNAKNREGNANENRENFAQEETEARKGSSHKELSTAFVSIKKKDFNDSGSIGKVEKYPVSDPEGEAILITQKHRHPGSDAESEINDAAERTQSQILDIISELHNKENVDILMNEGLVNGNGAEEKMESVSEKIELRDKFTNALSSLRESTGETSNSIVKSLMADAEKYVDKMNREILLEGAPYILKTKDRNNDLCIYGAEDKEIQEKSAEIVRNYIYLKDAKQRKNLVADREVIEALKEHKMSESSLLPSLLGGVKQSSAVNSLELKLRLLKKISPLLGDQDTSRAVAKINSAYEQIRSYKEGKSSVAGKDLPDREDNPYVSKSPAEIEKLMAKTEEQINKYVVEERNEKAADNFLKILKDNKEKVGIIQFGAGHKEGLTKELNNRGISVTVITPAEVWKAHQQ
jgi:hypothetical protein